MTYNDILMEIDFFFYLKPILTSRVCGRLPEGKTVMMLKS